MTVKIEGMEEEASDKLEEALGMEVEEEDEVEEGGDRNLNSLGAI